MQRQKYSVQLKPPGKISSSLELNNDSIKQKSSLDQKIGVTRMPESSLITDTPTRLNAYLITGTTGNKRQAYSTSKIYEKKKIAELRLPTIRQSSSFFQNPQRNLNSPNKFSPKKKPIISKPQTPQYYQMMIYKSLQSGSKQSSYLLTLAANHFQQTIQALKIGRHMKISTAPEQTLRLSKKNPKFKTVFLDLDQTLIHCDQNSTAYTVKLDFPVQNSSTIISAGIRVRPYCKEFLQQLAKIAEIIIFTASSQSYADVVLKYLDPNNKIFSHRLYRHHCRLEKGYYVKDLRIANRRLEDSLLVDNSAYCFMIQPFNGVPVLPFYHYGKDKELITLLAWLKQVLKENDVRVAIKKLFFWQRYFENDNDPTKIFENTFEQNFLR